MRFLLIKDYYDSKEYMRKLRARADVLSRCEDPLERERVIAEFWSGDPVRFIEDVLIIKIPEFQNALKPFFLFPYQVKILWRLVEAERSGEDVELLIDKLRGMGMTWLIAAYMYWRWLFTPNWSGFVLSRTETEVDNGTDNPDDCIFGKIRFFIKHTPSWLIPDGFSSKGKRGTSTDSILRLSNPTMSSSITGSSTNANAGRSRRYSFVFVDECFFIEHFREVWRALQSVARVKVFVSSVKQGKVAEQFRDMVAAQGNYLSLSWEDHPWKDQQWFDEKKKLAEFDDEVMKEISVDYSVSVRDQYYPEIRKATLVPLEYNPKLPVYDFIDIGKQDLTVIGQAQFDGDFINVIDCYYSNQKDISWYIPFMNPEREIEHPEWYNEVQLEKMAAFRSRKKPKGYFGEQAHFIKVMPLNISVAQVLFRYGIRLVYNKNAIKYTPRRIATAMLLPKTRFNSESEGVMDLYDAIAKSVYAKAEHSASPETGRKPVHTPEVADFRAAFENLCVNVSRVLKSQRADIGDNFKEDNFASGIVKYLKV